MCREYVNIHVLWVIYMFSGGLFTKIQVLDVSNSLSSHSKMFECGLTSIAARSPLILSPPDRIEWGREVTFHIISTKDHIMSTGTCN